MKRFICSLFLVFTVFTAASAQEYAHVNFGNLLSSLPGTAAAEAELKTFNDEQIAKGEEMVKELERDYLDIQQRSDEITPIKLREYEAQFQQRQQDILKYEQQIGLSLEKKRQELLGPLIQQARDAIDAVAKEKGYKMVFDSSLFNALLFTEESTDLLPAVKTKMGIE